MVTTNDKVAARINDSTKKTLGSIALNVKIIFSNYGATESSSAVLNHSSRDEDPRSQSTHQVFDKILSEQDQGLDSLHNVIVRSRVAAQNIHSEVGIQNEIIDGLGITKLLDF